MRSSYVLSEVSILGLVLGVLLMYYSGKKKARLRAIELALFARIITACQYKVAPSGVYTFVSFRVLARNHSHLPFLNPPFGPFVFSPAASCAPAYRHYHPVFKAVLLLWRPTRTLRVVYQPGGSYYLFKFTTVCSSDLGESRASATWGFGLSPLPSITTSPASCHRRFRLLSFFLSSIDGRKDKSSTDLNHCRNGTSYAAH
jgi:hypothetical protein